VAHRGQLLLSFGGTCRDC